MIETNMIEVVLIPTMTFVVACSGIADTIATEARERNEREELQGKESKTHSEWTDR